MKYKRCLECGEMHPVYGFDEGESVCRRCYIVCKGCHKFMHPERFYRAESNLSGREHYCHDCRKARLARSAVRRQAEAEGRVPEVKDCPRCERTLPAGAFHRRAGRGTLESWCRECKREAARGRPRRHAQTPAAADAPVQETAPAADDAPVQETTPRRSKRCAHCRQYLTAAQFYRVKWGAGLSSWCRPCTREAAAEAKLKRRR